MSTPRGLIFDLDGTLVDSFAGIHDALMHTKAHFGLAPNTLAETTAMVGLGLEVLLASALGQARVAVAVPVYRARYGEVVDSMTRALPGADALLRAAHTRGIVIALASNKPSYFSQRILKSLGWSTAFTVVLGPDLVTAPKPDPAMLHEAARLLGTTPADTLYVGDMMVDLEAAAAAAVPCALVANGSTSREALLVAGANASSVFDDLSELRTELGL